MGRANSAWFHSSAICYFDYPGLAIPWAELAAPARLGLDDHVGIMGLVKLLTLVSDADPLAGDFHTE
jgi:hypothetical protein